MVGKRKRLKSREVSTPRLSSDASHSVEFFMRPDDGAVPSLETFASWPNKAAGKLLPVLAAVAEAPPTKFDGGGKWEAMHGTCTGMYEVRARIDADSKSNGEVFAESRYVELSALRDEYFTPDDNGRPVPVACPGKPGCALYLADVNLRFCFQTVGIGLQREA